VARVVRITAKEIGGGCLLQALKDRRRGLHARGSACDSPLNTIPGGGGALRGVAQGGSSHRSGCWIPAVQVLYFSAERKLSQTRLTQKKALGEDALNSLLKEKCSRLAK